jgi:hypothetical protein
VIIELATNAPATRPQEQDVIESFKKLADQSGEDAGERQIGDIKAKAFRVRQVGSNAIVLVDPRTHLPIRVEFEVAGGRTKAVMENFNFDAKLDPSLFSLDPPAGYTVEHQNLSVNVDPLENMVWVLKAYAEKKQGQFPPHLDDLTEIFQTLSSSTTQPVPSRDQLMQMSAHGAAVTAILFSYEKGKTYDYLPDQARLGERDRIVFWYQPTKRGNYKAIFGDLHVAEVTADQLPKSPTK